MTRINDISCNFSEESYNRISIWIEALGNAYNYLQIEKDLDKYNADNSQYLSFILAERPHNLHKTLSISFALIEAALMNFWQVFSTGKKGHKISDNQKDAEIQMIRKTLVESSKNKLGWTHEQYTEIFNKIKTQRDKLLAHYDGDEGGFIEITAGISYRKMVGAHLSVDECIKFEKLVKVMYEYLFNLIYK